MNRGNFLKTIIANLSFNRPLNIGCPNSATENYLQDIDLQYNYSHKLT